MIRGFRPKMKNPDLISQIGIIPSLPSYSLFFRRIEQWYESLNRV